MKHKLFFNKLWLRVGMLVAIMTTALSGTVWAETYSLTPNSTNTGSTATSYITTLTEFTYSGISWKMNQWNPSNLQIKTNQSSAASEFRFYNTSAFSGRITQVVITFSALTVSDASKLMFLGGTSEVTATTGGTAGTWNSTAKTLTWTPGASDNFTYFAFYQNGKAASGTNKLASENAIVVTYETSGGSTLTANDLTLNATEKEFDLANGAGQTFQLTNSGVADGALSFESSNNAVATVSNTGLITAVGEGTATITVTQAASETYAGGTATCTVTVTDSRYSISNLTFTAACNGSGTADDGVAWTVTSDGTESAFDNTKGIHYGTGSAAVQYITLTTSGINGTIKKIVVNASTANDVSATASVTVGGAAFGGEAQSLTSSAADYTFTGSASGEIVVTVTKPESAPKALYVKNVKVYYIPSTDPYITAEDVTIAYDDEEGEIAYTINNHVSDGSIVASSTSDWLEVDNAAQTASTGTIVFICNPNPAGTQRTAEVTLTYTYNTNETLTKTVVITQAGNPDALVTIAEARAQGTGNVHTKGIVTSSVGTTAYIQDANAAICVYGESLTVGDEIEVSGTLTDFHGLLEITEPTVTVLSQENTVTPDVLTIAQVRASTKQGWLVKIENATVTEVGSSNNYTIAQGDETITLHGALGEVAVNDVITFTGNIGYYNSVQLVNPTDVTVTGTVTPTTYTLNWTAGEHTELFVFDAADETTPLTNGDEIAAGTTINVSIDVDEGYQLDALTVKDADDNDVTLTEITAGSYYSFTMPGSNVTINATATESSVTPTTGEKYVKVTSTDDLTDGQYLIVYETDGIAFNGGLGTLDAVSNTIDVTINNSEIVATTETKAAEFTIAAIEGGYSIKSASGQYIYHSGTRNGLSSSDEAQANDITFDEDGNVLITVGDYTLKYNKNSDQTRFRYFGSGQQSIQLYKFVAAPASQSVTVSSAGYATIVAKADLEIPENVEVYAVTVGESASSAQLTEVTGGVPAGKAVLVKASAGTYEFPYASATPEDIADNDLKASDGTITGASGNIYALGNKTKGVGFYKVAAGVTIPAGKAYLEVTTTPSDPESGVKAFYGFEDDATSINEELRMRNEELEGSIYNLAGQKIVNGKLPRGLYIVGGKKVFFFPQLGK